MLRCFDLNMYIYKIFVIKVCMQIQSNTMYAKTFDSINHARLMNIIYSCGIRGSLLNWIRSFLINRSQIVRVRVLTSQCYPGLKQMAYTQTEKKCKILSFLRGDSFEFKHTYLLNNCPLKHVKDLGVIFDNQPSCENHSDYFIQYASQIWCPAGKGSINRFESIQYVSQISCIQFW